MNLKTSNVTKPKPKKKASASNATARSLFGESDKIKRLNEKSESVELSSESDSEEDIEMYHTKKWREEKHMKIRQLVKVHKQLYYMQHICYLIQYTCVHGSRIRKHLIATLQTSHHCFCQKSMHINYNYCICMRVAIYS